MALHRITLQLARNPGYPVGDEGQGYFIIAPLDGDLKIDLDEWRTHRDACHVKRFDSEGRDEAEGRLTHRGSHWKLHYEDEDAEGADEEGYRLGEHRFDEGEYITIHHHEEGPLTYKVTDVTPLDEL